MRLKISCWMVLILVASVVPALSAEDRCTEPDIQTCLNDMAAKRSQGWLGLDFDRTDPNTIKVDAVTPYSPASKAGFRPGDVLLTLNGASFQDDVALAKARGDWKPGQIVAFMVQRPGYRKQLQDTRQVQRPYLCHHGRHAHARVPRDRSDGCFGSSFRTHGHHALGNQRDQTNEAGVDVAPASSFSSGLRCCHRSHPVEPARPVEAIDRRRGRGREHDQHPIDQGG